MKQYKGYPQFGEQVKRYIKYNNIKCKYYGWAGMAGSKDIVKIDGTLMIFDINTLERIE